MYQSNAKNKPDKEHNSCIVYSVDGKTTIGLWRTSAVTKYNVVKNKLYPNGKQIMCIIRLKRWNDNAQYT